MSSNTLYRLSGLGLLLGGILAAIGVVLSEIANSPTSSVYISGGTLAIAGGMLIVICFVGVYVRQAAQTGVLGLLGFILLMLSRLFLAISYGTFRAVVLPWLASVAPHLVAVDPPGTIVILTCGPLTSILGAIFFSIASIRATVFPRWISIFLVLGFVLNTVVNAVGLQDFGISSVLFQLAFASFGYVLLTRPRAETATHSPLSVASQA